MTKLANLLTRHSNQHTHPSYLTFVKGTLGMLVNPDGTESVFDIEDGLRESESTRELLKFTTKDSEVKKIIAERYLRPVPNTKELKKLPLGTLGRAYVEHLDTHGFDPDYYRKIDVQDDTDYIMMRIRQTHDIWHVVTGFDTHPLGEIAIKGVELAQTHRPMASSYLCRRIFRYMLRLPEEFGSCIESIAAGYHLGLRSQSLLAVKWEEMWDRELEEIRQTLDVVPLGCHGGALNVEFAPAVLKEIVNNESS